MKNKKRIYLMDNYKGLLIFLVVFAHFTWECYSSSDIFSNISTTIYLFHMPMFIFISGYFSKSENSRSFKSINKLLLYYVIFNTIMMIFSFFFRGGNINF